LFHKSVLRDCIRVRGLHLFFCEVNHIYIYVYKWNIFHTCVQLPEDILAFFVSEMNYYIYI
jgi:hypothetical protein